jgi:hypothetical protein
MNGSKQPNSELSRILERILQDEELSRAGITVEYDVDDSNVIVLESSRKLFAEGEYTVDTTNITVLASPRLIRGVIEKEGEGREGR